MPRRSMTFLLALLFHAPMASAGTGLHSEPQAQSASPDDESVFADLGRATFAEKPRAESPSPEGPYAISATPDFLRPSPERPEKVIVYELAQAYVDGLQAEVVDPGQAPDFGAFGALIDAQILRLDAMAEAVVELQLEQAISDQVAAELLVEIEAAIHELLDLQQFLFDIGRVGGGWEDAAELAGWAMDGVLNPITSAFKIGSQAIRQFVEAVSGSEEQTVWDMEERLGLDINKDGCKGATTHGACPPFDEDDEQVQRFPRSTKNVADKDGVIMVDIPWDIDHIDSVAAAFSTRGLRDELAALAAQDGLRGALDHLADVRSDLQVVNRVLPGLP